MVLIINVPMTVLATINGVRTVIGAGAITGFVGHLGARRADCGLPCLAHCLDIVRRLMKFVEAEMAPSPLLLPAPRRTGTWHRARLETMVSTSGGRMLRPTTLGTLSAGGCAESRRWRPPAAGAGSASRRPSRMVGWRGAGAPALGPIRCCMWELAVAHRDPLLLLRLPIVALRWIAMGTSYKSSGKLTTGAAAVGRHSAAMVTVKGSAAAGGRPSPWGDVLTVADGAALV